MPAPGDIVIARFPGAVVTKARPAVVVSSKEYHGLRPDCVLGLITSSLPSATTEFDHVLVDWAEAGLDRPSAFRSYLATATARDLVAVGHLSERDGLAMRRCIADVLDK
jgi:hypothetical protein